MGSRTRGNLGGSGYGASRQDWAAHKFQPKKLLENGAFVSKENLDMYLSGDFIMCLECGQDCRSLGHHLSRTHAMSSLEYKIKYNIPKGRSLRGESTRKLSAIGAAKQWENADGRRDKLRQHAKDKLGDGYLAPRLAHFDKVIHDKICPTCKKVFHPINRFALKKYTYCSKACHTASDTEQARLKVIAKKGGRKRASTGEKDSTGKFTSNQINI